MTVVEINGWFGGTELVELNDEGVIDEDVVEAFTRGHCHSFALALAEALPGLELFGVDWDEAFDWNEDEFIDMPNHVVCMDAAGQLWDVRGLNRERDPEPLDVELVRSGFGGQYFDPQPEVAVPFLAAWLEAHREDVIL